jgi:teichuronic acid biosynthesis glycosyltransferase TuaC
MPRPIRTLLVSTLFPSSARPVHGIFVETRLQKLLETGLVETRVIAPVPWFPFRHKRFGDYAKFAATPNYEKWHGLEVHHPRYLLLPKIGMNLAPQALAKAALAVAKQLIRDGFDFDLIDAHYYYPDGVAAGMLAKELGKPFVVTARGTDLNLIPEFEQPRKLILETADRASASIGVCKALMDRLAELGADSSKLHVLRNGVDLERFQPMDRQESRAKLGLPLGKTILISVGLLCERKGHHIAIEALPHLPDVRLVVVGEGEERQNLEELAKKLGVADRVKFAGRVDNDQLKWWYSAADALVLCSSREGWANVLLESMACGTPVIATNIWGTPEVVTYREAGVLMQKRSSEGLCHAFNQLFGQYPSRECTRRYAEGFSWDETTGGQLDIFNQALGRND